MASQSGNNGIQILSTLTGGKECKGIWFNLSEAVIFLVTHTELECREARNRKEEIQEMQASRRMNKSTNYFNDAKEMK